MGHNELDTTEYFYHTFRIIILKELDILVEKIDELNNIDMKGDLIKISTECYENIEESGIAI